MLVNILFSFGLTLVLVNIHVGFLNAKRRGWIYGIFNWGLALLLALVIIDKM